MNRNLKIVKIITTKFSSIQSLTRTEKINIDKITPEFLLNLEEDVLYEFFPTYSF